MPLVRRVRPREHAALGVSELVRQAAEPDALRALSAGVSHADRSQSPVAANVTRCECDWTWHKGRACTAVAADHGDVRVSPALCWQCLIVCEGERDDDESEGETL